MSVSGSEVEGYTKTAGAWILSLSGRKYSVTTAVECARKCDAEATFTCRQVHSVNILHHIIFKSSSASRTTDSIDAFTGLSYISKRTRNVGPSEKTQNLRLSCAEVAQCCMKKKVRLQHKFDQRQCFAPRFVQDNEE